MQLIRKLEENRDSDAYPFHMPGHKRRLAGDDILLNTYGIDITEIDGFDNLHNAKGIISKAQERAAKLFGANETHFLVNGSTGGLLAAITAAVTVNDNLIIAANCHRSVYNAAMLSGADLYVMTPGREEIFGISGGIDKNDVESALSGIDGSGQTAVVITSPTYEGITSDIKEIAKVCHEHQAYLIVDSAHGAHFGLSDAFPESCIPYADVVVTSVHKTLPAMTQTALIHINEKCGFADRIRRQLSVFTTSSPSYVLMASIDSATDLMTRRGRELFAAYEQRLNDLYDKISGLRNLICLRKEDLSCKGSYDLDRGKVVVKDRWDRISGRELSDMLIVDFGLIPEMSAVGYVILMTSVADDDEGFKRLADALSDIDKRLDKLEKKDRPVRNVRSEERNLLRKITGLKGYRFASKTVWAGIDKAEGMTSADLVTIYPPGIPTILPGDVITKETVDAITNALSEERDVIGINNGKIAVWERSST